jgi:hypothetical protein
LIRRIGEGLVIGIKISGERRAESGEQQQEQKDPTELMENVLHYCLSMEEGKCMYPYLFVIPG